ncbi:hypothetical protein IWW45_006750 [Coemansia sp. RSA 485]|nr:hypothetical protein IWW45_006750 [Coemansia sp. RSA 485]
MLVPNTAISADAMLGVLQQLPQMSDKIVDDTRHEKVLSYMQLFLATPGAIKHLVDWEAVGLLDRCLQPTSDHRISSVAVRFLGDCVAAADGAPIWATLCSEHQRALRWVAENADSPHALVRFSCLYFLRQAACTRGVGRIMGPVDSRMLVLRRLLDASYFVVAEACRLLSTMCYRRQRIQTEWFAMAQKMGARAYNAQSSAHKEAVLAATATFYAHEQKSVREQAAEVLPLDRLGLYLFDCDRLVRDHALDVLEAAVRTAASVDCVMQVLGLLRRQGHECADRPVRVAVKLRSLAVLVRAAPQGNSACGGIAALAMTVLQHIHGGQEEPSDEPSELPEALLEIKHEVLAHSNRRLVSGEAARIAREHCRHTLDRNMLGQLEHLLAQPSVIGSPQLLHTVLEAIVNALHLSCSQTDVDALQMLPDLAANFAIRAPGLKMLLGLALEILDHRRLSTTFVASLTQALATRMVDVEWEPRDTVLEFASGAVDRLGWGRAKAVVEPLVEDVVSALGDPEEYVRAAAVQVLVRVVSSADAATRSRVAGHPGLTRVRLGQLLGDSEAFVKRAAFDLVAALALAAEQQREKSREWLHCLAHRQLYLVCDDPDFEVRLRCTRLLAQLTRWLHFGVMADADRLAVKELQVDALLLDMCNDSSRYVRLACLESLRDMQGRRAKASEEQGVEHPEKRRTNDTDTFCEKLGSVDFGRLERSLSTEHLYQEAVDRQVDRQLMTEADDVNAGNNILECY